MTALTSGRVHVGTVSEFQEGDRRLVTAGDRQIGVFRCDSGFVAYENRCLHQGGPVCEGRYFPLIRAVVAPDGRVLGEQYDRSTPHLVCPWHGWEYDLRTGEFAGNRALKLRQFPVEIEGDEVYVVVG